MSRSFAVAALAAFVVAAAGLRPAPVAAEEPKATGTVDIFSSVDDLEKEKQLPGTGVIYGQKEWERLAAAWGIKEVPKVDFSKELLLVGTWRGTTFKMLSEVKNGDLTVELVGDKETTKPGFRYKVISIKRDGITKFQGKDLPPPATSDVGEPKSPGGELKTEKPRVSLSGDIKEITLLTEAPANGVIVSQKQWNALAKVWAIKDPPKVDFTKELLVVGTWRGSQFDMTPTVTDGDLTVAAKGTRDLREGFRWKIVSVNRAGIKTVHGKELPKE